MIDLPRLLVHLFARPRSCHYYWGDYYDRHLYRGYGFYPCFDYHGRQGYDPVFAYNSATHSGDGFLLYAGNETLNRTGRGGCNRNVVYRNDFSHAAANGIESTFSEGNLFMENRLDECEHGVWAGYSYNTVVAGNRMGRCKNGVSIEHGQNNVIAENVKYISMPPSIIRS